MVSDPHLGSAILKGNGSANRRQRTCWLHEATPCYVGRVLYGPADPSPPLALGFSPHIPGRQSDDSCKLVNKAQMPRVILQGDKSWAQCRLDDPISCHGTPALRQFQRRSAPPTLRGPPSTVGPLSFPPTTPPSALHLHATGPFQNIVQSQSTKIS